MFRSLIPKVYRFFTQNKRNCQYVCNKVTPTFPATKTSLTENGIRVSTEESCSPVVCLSMIAEVGPRYETAFTNGMAHLVEHMAFKGFTNISKSKLECDLTVLGIHIDIQTFREFQIFTAKCLPEQVLHVIDLYARVVTEMELSDHELELEKYNMCLELLDTDNDPKAVLFDYLHQTAFQGTPLMRRVIGSTDNIRNFERENIRCYIRDNYQPYRLIISASGNVYHDNILGYVMDRFACLVPEYCHEIDLGPARYTGSEVRYRDDSMPFCHVAIAVEVPGYTSPDYLKLMTASSLIGSWDKSQHGSKRPASLLAQAASTSQLCESYQSFYVPYRDIGLWGVYFVADKMQLEDMLFNIQNNWMRMTTMAPYAEVDRAVNMTKLKMAKRMDGCLRSCYDIGIQTLYSCYRTTLPEFYDRLSNIGSHSIREIGDNYIYDKCPVVVAVGPCDNLPEYTRIRAGMYWLRF